MAKTPQNDFIGKEIDGKYRIERVVGTGGMGTVYEATELDLGRKVAFKRLRDKFTDNQLVVQRFQQEAELAASLGHDNICEVVARGTTEEGNPYLIMPLLTGQSLAALLKQGQLTTERTIDICAQVLSALDAVHKAHIVHRDLKPSNIFITKIGDRKDFVKLLDLGVSKIMGERGNGVETAPGAMLGTPLYMAPEQVKGVKSLDHRVDIYAMGVILYECLTGTKPYDGNSYNKILYAKITKPFAPPTAINPNIAREFELIILKAMSDHPASRYLTAEKMREELLMANEQKVAACQLDSTSLATAATGHETFLDIDDSSSGKSKSGKKGRVVLLGLTVAFAVAAGAFWFLGTSSVPSPANVEKPPIPSEHKDDSIDAKIETDARPAVEQLPPNPGSLVPRDTSSEVRDVDSPQFDSQHLEKVPLPQNTSLSKKAAKPT